MKVRERVREFFLQAESDSWLTWLRVGLGLVIVLYTWPLRSDWSYLFGGSDKGLVSRQLFEVLLSTQSPLIPRLGWLVFLCRQVGGSEGFALSLAWSLLFAAGLLLLAGLFSRPAAIVAWLLQLSSAKSGGLLSYGADNLITIGLFYLMIAPLPDRRSLERWRRPARGIDPRMSGLHRRVLQIHLCFIYFFGGLTKSLGAGWWDGSNLWRALTEPPFNVLPTNWVAAGSALLPSLGILVCLIEISYAFLIWPKWSRRTVLFGICAMHIAIGLMMGMYLFALIMLVLNLAAFGPAEPGQKAIGSVATGRPEVGAFRPVCSRASD